MNRQMSPGLRALVAHGVGFIFAVGVAWAVTYLLSAALLDPQSVSLVLLALVAVVAGAVGFAVWSGIVTRLLGIATDRRWWALGFGAVAGLLVLATGLMAAGIFAPPQALFLMLFLLFALGGWATHGRVTDV